MKEPSHQSNLILAARLEGALSELDQAHLRRRLRVVEKMQGPHIMIEGRKMLQFCSNDYLGLAGHPRLQEAAQRAMQDYGLGATASRFILGNSQEHHLLEAELADGKGVQRALLFSSGYAAAVGALPALCSSDDVILLDKLAHACLIDGARASAATLRTFRHNDLDHLESQLQKIRHRLPASGVIWIVTESIFSMDGDAAPLPQIVHLKERYGALLWVDEAHALGVRRDPQKPLGGLIAELQLQDHVEIQMGTLGKALGVSGGYLAGSQTMVELLRQRSRSQIYSTALPPAVMAAARAAIKIIEEKEGEQRHAQLWYNIKKLHQGLAPLQESLSQESHKRISKDPSKPENTLPSKDATDLLSSSAILPWIVGASQEALRMEHFLWEQGYYVPAIRYPTVARNKARLRFSVTADHREEQIEALLLSLRKDALSQHRENA